MTDQPVSARTPGASEDEDVADITFAEIESLAKHRWSQWPASQGADGFAWEVLSDEQRQHWRDIVSTERDKLLPDGTRLVDSAIVAAWNTLANKPMSEDRPECWGKVRAWLANRDE